MTHIIDAAWRTYLRLNTRANRAYDMHMVELEATVPDAAPKTDRHKGRGTGICERCGIDSTDLRRQKCTPCTSYLRRRKRASTPRDCPQCATTHTSPGRVCSSCRVRNHRDRNKG